jgi:glycosyltransferase involved in cell wall biosynthesis
LKVSFTGAPEWMDRNVGYGEASFHIFEELGKQGIECVTRSLEPNIGISFIQPDKYSFAINQYRIGYTPWESTEIFPSWKVPLAELVDEVWATNEYTANVFRQYTSKPVFIYQHGVEDTWIPKKRNLDKSRPLRFLHIGEPSSRKDAQMVVDAFISVFGDDPNYELILKCTGLNTTKVYDPITKKVYGSPGAFYKNIKTIESMLSVEQINGLYDLCDVFVYPSWGEGFGFNPLQGMAKGIPTICTAGWASYANYITLPIDSVWAPSPWPIIHPGNMMKPDYQQLKEHMLNVAQDYERYSDIAYKNSFLVHKDFSWARVTKPAAERLKEIQKQHF